MGNWISDLFVFYGLASDGEGLIVSWIFMKNNVIIDLLINFLESWRGTNLRFETSTEFHSFLEGVWK